MGDKRSASDKIMARLESLSQDMTKGFQTVNNNQELLKNRMEHLEAELELIKKKETDTNDVALKKITKDIQTLTELQNAQNMEIQSSVSDIQTAVNNLFKTGAKTTTKAAAVVAAPDTTTNDDASGSGSNDATTVSDAAASGTEPEKKKRAAPAFPKNTEMFFKKRYREKCPKVGALITAEMVKECSEAEEVKKSKNGAPRKQAESKLMDDLYEAEKAASSE
jgi:hypothetical protein